MVASGVTATGDQFWPRTGELVGVTGVFFVVSWCSFVPIGIEFDRVEVTIRYLFRRGTTIPWHELERYGPRNNVFVLQFETCSFQILSDAFAPAEWHQLITLLDTRFGDCKDDEWFGLPRLFRWRRK